MSGYKTIFSIEGSHQDDVVNGIKKAGYNLASLNNPVSLDAIRDIIGTLSTSFRNQLSTGRAELIPRGSAVFSKDGDSINVIDFDVQARQREYSDPVIIVIEQIPGRTSNIIKEILEDVVKIDIIKNSLLSLDSRQFRTSVNDLARINCEDPRETYNRCVTSLVRSCVSGIKTIDIDPFELTTKSPRQATKQTVQTKKQKVTAV
ncbi:hypothetical protein [Nitrosarchaeum sp. AC2]|uniref:hypothetical protein n=1 Tax=Nitrosarchaeum sp. AC2 TaxID=2259673 RepID=UPI0015CEAF81|nr:hypothetical protein [Nitrosarchaeum sp. AC2]QLH11232.1 hypothetical protein DSQ20_07005 [Nitrosarchaeum sp. AC2]